MPLKFTPATIKVLATLVQVLDKHPLGAVTLVLAIAATCGVIATAAVSLHMAVI